MAAPMEVVMNEYEGVVAPLLLLKANLMAVKNVIKDTPVADFTAIVDSLPPFDTINLSVEGNPRTGDNGRDLIDINYQDTGNFNKNLACLLGKSKGKPWCSIVMKLPGGSLKSTLEPLCDKISMMGGRRNQSRQSRRNRSRQSRRNRSRQSRRNRSRRHR